MAPAEASGKAGDRIGPFTVSMTGGVSDLKTDLPEGTELADADGSDLAESDIADGAEIYVDVRANADASSGSFEIETTGHVNTGRLFVAGNYRDRPAQSLIVAQSEDVTLSAGAIAKWEAVPTTTKPPEETTTTTAPPSRPRHRRSSAQCSCWRVRVCCCYSVAGRAARTDPRCPIHRRI